MSLTFWIENADKSPSVSMTPTAPAVSAEKPAPCLTRQPIFTKDEKVMGYEVSCRETSASAESAPNLGQAPGGIVDAVKNVGLDVLCDNHLAFIPCTHEMLVQDNILDLPHEKIVVEIHPGIEVDASLIEACGRLKKSGFKIAIDNFRKGDGREQLLALADFLKVDLGSRGAGHPSQIAAAHAGKPYKMLAQNVNSRAEYKNAERAGFKLFQGYFFLHPENMRVRQIPTGQTSKVRLLQAVSAPEIDLPLVEELIRHDASLCFRLMRYLNSPLLGLAVPVQSVRQAMSLLGERALTRWIRTATALSVGQPKCSYLVLASLVRARFCELIAPQVEHGNADLFLLGMFSLMDVILETPLEILMEGLAFDTSAKAALLAMKNGGGARLSPVCDLVVAREKGDWERVTTHATKLNLSLQVVNRAYLEAMEWAHQIMKG
jgi:EAL and modified HD-GYP domain-containing signal transduction protein